MKEQGGCESFLESFQKQGELPTDYIKAKALSADYFYKWFTTIAKLLLD